MINPKTIRIRKKVSLKTRNDYWVYTTVFYNETDEPIVESELRPVGFSRTQSKSSNVTAAE